VSETNFLLGKVKLDVISVFRLDLASKY